VVINEFSSATSSDWVELYNAGDGSVDLGEYRLRDENPNNKKDLSGILESGEIVSFNYSNYLNVGGDTIKLFKISEGNEIPEDSISYGSEGQVCSPSDAGSIGRYPSDGNNTHDRFAAHTRDLSNENATLDPCPTPTPEPSATPNPTSTPEPTSTPKPTPTVQKTPTPKPTIKATATKKVVPTQSPVAIKQGEDSDEVILGLRNQLSITPTENPGEESNRKFPFPAILMIVGGISFMGAAGYPFITAFKKTTGKARR
jgi:hypothetical protein